MGHQQVICESFLSKNFICHQFVKVSPAKVLAITALSMDIKASAKVFCGNAATSSSVGELVCFQCHPVYLQSCGTIR